MVRICAAYDEPMNRVNNEVLAEIEQNSSVSHD